MQPHHERDDVLRYVFLYYVVCFANLACCAFCCGLLRCRVLSCAVFNTLLFCDVFRFVLRFASNFVALCVVVLSVPVCFELNFM